MRAEPLLEVTDLEVAFPGRRSTVEAVRGASFSIGRGERVGIAGESGSGKTVTALAIAGLLVPTAQITGSIRFQGQELTALSRRRRRQLCGSAIGMIFQDPLNSLNPAMSIGDQIAEVLRVRRRASRGAARTRAIELLGEVGIPRPRQNYDEYPHRFSGGMRQRVMIAVALSARPALIIADEPTTALDVTIQAQIVDLLERICQEHEATLLMITHDLGVLAGIADQLLVMYSGRILERGPVERIYYGAGHPYTWALLGSTVRLDRPRAQPYPIPGEPPSATSPPGGCPYHPRCPHAEPVCQAEVPPEIALDDGHLSACHFAGRLPRPEALTSEPA